MQLNKYPEEIKLCLEYSQNKALLNKVLEEIKVYLSEPVRKTYFNEKVERNVYSVQIKRGEIKISFHYGDSIDNTNKNKRPRLYDLLACCGSDYHTPKNFKDFCAEYGYNEDSIKANKLFKRCLMQSKKLKTIFSEEEAEALPQ